YRHTADSGFSHFEPHPAFASDPFEGLVRVVEKQWDSANDGNEKYVVVSLDQPTMARYGRFFSSVVHVTPRTRLHGYFAARKGGVAGELEYLHASVLGGSKAPAVTTDIIVYNQKELKEEERRHDEKLLDADFHLISLNCNPTA